MSQSFSTDLVPVSDRLDAWLCNARRICGDCRFEFPKQPPFHGAIERRSVAGVELTLFSSTPVAFAKSPVVEANARDRGCIIIMQIKGARRYLQSGEVAILQPGDTTIIDSGRPWSSDCAFACARLYLRLPRWLVENRLSTSALPTVPRIAGKSGLGATLFRLGTSLFEQAEVLTPEQGMAAIEAYLAILSGCLGRCILHPIKQNRGMELLPRIDRFIEIHLAKPALRPAEIASGLGISVRHLHRVFHEKGVTVGEWILQKRLERCHSELADPSFAHRNITDIAYGWGFSDSAHFSRCFRKKYGIPPREFRQESLKHFWNAANPGTLSAASNLLNWRN